MTPTTQAAVEAVAKARWNADHITQWDTLSAGVQKDRTENEQAALVAFLAHLDATGWQIVPKVATEEMCRAWENSTNGDVAFGGMTDDEVNNIIASRDYAAMIAAAPKWGG